MKAKEFLKSNHLKIITPPYCGSDEILIDWCKKNLQLGEVTFMLHPPIDSTIIEKGEVNRGCITVSFGEQIMFENMSEQEYDETYAKFKKKEK